MGTPKGRQGPGDIGYMVATPEEKDAMKRTTRLLEYW
jgi:hypothetical protein